MVFEPEGRYRKSHRLPGYDYSRPGKYFVTANVQDNHWLFGDVANGEMQLNLFGQIISYYWRWLEKRYHHVKHDEWIVMPNHLHGILVLTDDDRGGSRTALTSQNAPPRRKRKPLGQLIGAFKTVSTKCINQILETPGNRIWQRDFHDHIIRNEEELHRIRHYIKNNPKNWKYDDPLPQFL